VKPRSLWKVSVAASPEADEAIQECLSSVLEQPVSSYTEADTGRVTVSAYLSNRSEFSAARQAAISAQLEGIFKCGLLLRPVRVRFERIRREDWAESWKHHFQPLEIGDQLLLRPSWSKRRPKRGQAVVVLDPGLSFGTGQHPTTRFCLEQLVAARQIGTHQSFLDVGTGSGILAIAAAKLGYARIVAFDNDPDSVRVAAANARQHGVRRRSRLSRMDVGGLAVRESSRFDVICANLIFDLLVQERRRIAGSLAPGGRLVLAGILRSQFPGVCQAYEHLGLKLLARQREGEWESGVFSHDSVG